jgi:hypothetical protein
MPRPTAAAKRQRTQTNARGHFCTFQDEIVAADKAVDETYAAWRAAVAVAIETRNRLLFAGQAMYDTEAEAPPPGAKRMRQHDAQAQRLKDVADTAHTKRSKKQASAKPADDDSEDSERVPEAGGRKSVLASRNSSTNIEMKVNGLLNIAGRERVLAQSKAAVAEVRANAGWTTAASGREGRRVLGKNGRGGGGGR